MTTSQLIKLLSTLPPDTLIVRREGFHEVAPVETVRFYRGNIAQTKGGGLAFIQHENNPKAVIIKLIA